MKHLHTFESYQGNGEDLAAAFLTSIRQNGTEYLQRSRATLVKFWLPSRLPGADAEAVAHWTPILNKLIEQELRDRTAKMAAREPYFTHSVVRDENDKLLTLYHGSKHEFTEFQHHPGFRGSSLGGGEMIQSPCFFFSENQEFSEMYGEHLHRVHLDMENPLEFDGTGWRKFLNRCKQVDVDGHYIFHDYDGGVIDCLYQSHPQSEWQYLNHYLSSGHGHVWEMFDNAAFIELLEDNGFDGLIFYEYEADDYGKGKEVDSKTYAVFHAEQIKILD